MIIFFAVVVVASVPVPVCVRACDTWVAPKRAQ
jgi:hypothetical protein